MKRNVKMNLAHAYLVFIVFTFGAARFVKWGKYQIPSAVAQNVGLPEDLWFLT